jgi:hypothetical protein
MKYTNIKSTVDVIAFTLIVVGPNNELLHEYSYHQKNLLRVILGFSAEIKNMVKRTNIPKERNETDRLNFKLSTFYTL